MKWPLSDAEYAEIRANVMREVRSPVAGRRSPGVLRLAFVAIAMALAVLFVRRPASPPPGQPRAAVLHRIPAPPVAVAPATVVVQKKTHQHRHHHVYKPETQLATRMDIQTADPDVRIIWIAR